MIKDLLKVVWPFCSYLLLLRNGEARDEMLRCVIRRWSTEPIVVWLQMINGIQSFTYGSY